MKQGRSSLTAHKVAMMRAAHQVLVVPPSSQHISRRLIFRLLSYKMTVLGEPWKSTFDPQQLAADLKSIGFTQTEGIGPEDMNTRYFNHREDKLMVGSFGHLMKARH